jgi:hypothetical protein
VAWRPRHCTIRGSAIVMLSFRPSDEARIKLLKISVALAPHPPLQIVKRGSAPFDLDDWLFEIKHDGFRVIAIRDGGPTRLFTRNGYDISARHRWTVRSPGQVLSLRRLSAINRGLPPLLSDGAPPRQRDGHRRPGGSRGCDDAKIATQPARGVMKGGTPGVFKPGTSLRKSNA